MRQTWRRAVVGGAVVAGTLVVPLGGAPPASACAAYVGASAQHEFLRDVVLLDSSLRVARRLTRDGRSGTPAFSPDGRWVAYSSVQDDTARVGNRQTPTSLYVVPTTGGQPRRLTTGNAHDRYAAWSPNSASIAFVRDFADLMVVDVATGLERRVSAEVEAYAPVWLSQTRLAYVRYRAGVPRLTVVDLATDTRSELVVVAGPVVWSPDRSRFAYPALLVMTDSDIPVSRLVVRDAHTGQETEVTQAPGVVPVALHANGDLLFAVHDAARPGEALRRWRDGVTSTLDAAYGATELNQNLTCAS